MRNLSYAIVFVCGILATFFNYSCSNDDYYADEAEVGINGVAQTRAFSSRTMNGEYTLIDSIATSDEFWEFEMSNELLAEKLRVYTATLSEEEYDHHMNNINNDDYMADIIQKADMNEVLQQVDKAREKLFNQTGFLRLSKEERTQLFTLFAESRLQTKTNSLKTRQEGGGNTSECEKQRDATIRAAKLEFDNSVSTCGNIPLVAQLCYMNAAAIYDREKRLANEDYQTCIGN